MKSFNHYKMELRPRSELTTGLVLYGETEPAEMQIENLWKIVDRRTGEELADPKPDFDEFSSSDRMYPSMMKPEVKRRWDLKNYEWEETKAQHAKLRRMVHAQFMEQNPNMPIVQKLKKTTYGNKIQNEFKNYINTRNSDLYEFYQEEPDAVDSNSLQNQINPYVENKYRNMNSTSKTPPKKTESNSTLHTYWTVHPKSKACIKCKEMTGYRHNEEPERPHPNCKCEIRKHTSKKKPKDDARSKEYTINGSVSSQTSFWAKKFIAGQSLQIKVRNMGPSVLGGVDISVDGSSAINPAHIPIGTSKTYRISQFGKVPVTWDLEIKPAGVDNCFFTFEIYSTWD
ncbi:hypothetical protein [Desulfovibrio sp. JC010]|uniref:hypothetical protein n=1 Tax=Desulfovibrio sp. JC010 TaxID=2593641 RepID=UPI0013CF969D|nr:hypothetical protein [Desulfovibrio sp. JC010]NDV27516.1 hypothetical protein [Desulfovibrio sp. JC010]